MFVRRSLLSAGLVGALVLLHATSAWAGETESRTLFAQGRELRVAGKCDEAIPLFRKALDTFPEGLGSLRNIAECEEELHHFASARRAWWDLRLAVLQSATSKYEGWNKDAEDAYTRLGPRVPRVKIRVKGTDEPRLRLNGRPFDPRLVGTVLEQDVGPLEIVLEDGSASPPKKQLVLEEGKSYEVELEAVAHVDASKPGKPGAKPDVTKPADTGMSGTMLGGIVAMSVGGAALAGAGIAIGIRQSALSEVEAGCRDPDNLTGCDPSVKDAESRGSTASTLFDVLVGVGGVGVGVGVALVIVDVTGAGDEPKKAALTVTASPRTGGGVISVGGAF